MITYELITKENGQIVVRTNEDGTKSWIPTNLANSDYQSYLEHLTENPTE
jgi:hypothetical protein